jgi:hypothetical protein
MTGLPKNPLLEGLNFFRLICMVDGAPQSESARAECGRESGNPVDASKFNPMDTKRPK